MIRNSKFKYSVIALVASVVVGNQVYAAVDSGQALSTTLGSKELTFTRDDGKVVSPSVVGVKDEDVAITLSNVTVEKVSVSGNTVFTSEQLEGLFSEIIGNTYTPNQLQVVAARVNFLYKKNGYPIVRTLITVDKNNNKTLQIKVIEAKLANVKVVGEQAESDNGPIRFVNAAVTPGFPVSSQTVERASLLIDDLPGMRATPIIKPGPEFSTSDLLMQVERVNSFDGRIGYDNAGSRFTGQDRLSLDFNLNSPFMFGDRLGFKAKVSNEHLRAGEIFYELPISSDGWRAELAAGRVKYQIANIVPDTSSYGDATYERLRFSYPLVRSQLRNIYASVGIEHRKLQDHQDDVTGFIDQGGTPVINQQSKTGYSVPFQLRFDNRDYLNGGGLTYGAVGVTVGRVKLDDNALTVASVNNPSAGSSSNYQKYNLDIARIQRLIDTVTLFARYSIQTSGSNNLDSYDLIALGGPDGVRAYPVFEGAARKGQILQTEFRYQFQPAWTSFVFYDVAQGKNPVTVINTRENRTLSGYGLGLRQQSKTWDLDATVAWRITGGDVQSEDRNKDPRFFVKVGYKF
jgi:hemolysin activation/secretion protein